MFSFDISYQCRWKNEGGRLVYSARANMEVLGSLKALFSWTEKLPYTLFLHTTIRPPGGADLARSLEYLKNLR